MGDHVSFVNGAEVVGILRKGDGRGGTASGGCRSLPVTAGSMFWQQLQRVGGLGILSAFGGASTSDGEKREGKRERERAMSCFGIRMVQN